MKLAMAEEAAAAAAGKKGGGALGHVLGPLMCHKAAKRAANRDKLTRVCSLIADSEVTPGSLEIWSDLPEEIKNDPSLAPFKNRYERQFGSKLANSTLVGEQIQNTSLENHNESRIAPPSIPTANGVPSQHKVSSDNNNIGSNAYFNKTIENIETGTPTIVPALSKQMSDYGNELPHDDMGYYGNNTNPGHHQANVPKVSFLSLLETPSTLESNQKQQNHSMPHGTSAHEETECIHPEQKPWIKNIKIVLLLICWVIFTLSLLLKVENPDVYKPISVPINESGNFIVFDKTIPKSLSIELDGPFVPEQYGNVSKYTLNIWLEIIQLKNKPTNIHNKTELELSEIESVQNASSNVWHLALIHPDLIDSVPSVDFTKTFQLDLVEDMTKPNSYIKVMLSSNLNRITPLTMKYNTKPIDIEYGIMYAAVVLSLLYILIIFEVVHRTFAAMIASTLSIGILAALDQRPSTAMIISWIDMETLLLLFSMMVIVAILSETGIFDFLAVYAYKVTAGRVWPLINCLCLFTAVMSSFLDNVTTVLLMTPVTIRLCEVMELNPVPILMSMVIFSNIGGTLTPVGDPPNVIIASNARIQEAGIDFTTFTMHMFVGILLVIVQTYIHIRIYFRNMNSLRHSEPKEIRELRHEISIWQHAAASLSSYSKDEDIVRVTLVKKVNRLLSQLKKKVNSGKVAKETYKATLQDLLDKYPIRNKVLLVKSAVAVSFVIIFFFLHSFPQLRLSLGWTALLGALLLLILADRNDMEAVLARVEWSTLLFFAALFILMEALSKLGLISWIGGQTENIIMSVSEESRLLVAILLILWVSAVASAFVDNIPLTTMMIRIATDLGDNPELNLPLQPLVWALAFGACLGGNGTLIGASANVVCAGVAEQHGYRFSFMEYFKVGFPVMLGSVTVITGYLIVCHVVIGWNGS